MDIITLSNFRYRIGTSSTNKHFRMLLLDLMRIFGSTMDAIRNSKIFRLSSTFLSLLNSWGNWVLTLIITFKLWMMCGCVRVIKLVCVWQMEFAPNDTTQRMPSYWPQWNRLSRIYFLHLCNATCGLSTMLSRLKQTVAKCRFYHMALLTRTRALVWKSGFEHLLFTLVFNLKFNLLKQLKAHTSWPNTLLHTFTRTRRYPHIHAWNLYCENVECAKSLFFAYPTNQTIHSTQSSKATGKRIRNEDDNNSNHGSKKIAPSWVNRLHSAGGWWRVSCISSAHTATKQAEGAKRFNYFTRVFKTNILWPFAVCFLFIAIRHKRRTYMRSLIHSLTWTHQRPML